MVVGLLIWQVEATGPGPWPWPMGFKAANTLDSMLGYRLGTLQCLRTAGARLDDLMAVQRAGL